MRQLWLLWIATAPAMLLVCASTNASAQECTGLESASQARWSASAVRRLDSIASKTRGERRRDIDALEEQRSANSVDDPRREYLEGLRMGLTTTVDSRHHLGMTACRGDGRAGARLGSTWWGTYYELEDLDVRPDFENSELPYKGGRMFYVRSRHRLHSRSDSLAWSSAIVGAGWDFAAEASLTVAGLHTESPDSDAWQTWQAGDPVETTDADGWGMYTAVTLPFVGTRLSIASQPKFSGLALAQLETDAIPLGSLRGGFKVGMTREDGPLLAAVGVYDIPGGFRTELGGYPLLLAPAFAQVQWTHPIDWVQYSPPDHPTSGDERIFSLQVLPFVNVSANYAPEELSDDAGWFPGYAAGTEVRAYALNAANSDRIYGVGVGLQLEGGVNQPQDLQAVPSLRGRGYWGMQLNVYWWSG